MTLLELAGLLTASGLSVVQPAEGHLIVSVQEGPVWPGCGNSFRMSCVAGVWYLSTWNPICYRIPLHQDLVGLCESCMRCSTSAMYKVPPDLVARYELVELTDEDYELLFPGC